MRERLKVLPARQVDDDTAPGGKRGMRFKDLCNHEIARYCNLTDAEVFCCPHVCILFLFLRQRYM